jgi:hypothetical protein
VKDGSGALYCFVPQGKTIKAGTNSLTQSCEEGRRSNLQGHAQIIVPIHLLVLPNNCLKFKMVKYLFGLQKFYNFAVQFYYVN